MVSLYPLFMNVMFNKKYSIALYRFQEIAPQILGLIFFPIELNLSQKFIDSLVRHPKHQIVRKLIAKKKKKIKINNHIRW